MSLEEFCLSMGQLENTNWTKDTERQQVSTVDIFSETLMSMNDLCC